MVRRQRRDLEIIGIARDLYSVSVRRPPSAMVYVAYAQLNGDVPTTLEVRTSGSFVQVMSAIKSIFQQKLPAVAVDFRPLSAQVDATIVQERMMAKLAGAFGVLALVMSCIGIYGLLAYTVARRTKEMGIRMALGAHSSHVIGIVVKRAVTPVVIGVALGLPAAWGASRSVESMLFGLKRNDPFAIGGAILLLAVCALLAAYLPAYRASRIDPLIALRHE
jgi:ABC-type antimicrobial peptide transport system permease subunit